MTGFDGVVAGLLRGLLRGLNPHLVKVLVFLRGLRGSKLLFLFLLILFAGLSRGFSHMMQNATNYLKCFEYSIVRTVFSSYSETIDSPLVTGLPWSLETLILR